MMRKRIVGIVVLMFLLSLNVTAQSIVWQLKPTDYSEIVRFGPDIYKVTKNGKFGLIHSNGDVIVPVTCNRITDFYEGKALVLGSETDNEGFPQVLGYLTDQGQYVQFEGTYYALKGLEFYSNGLLPANDAKGRRGYLDTKGNAELGFDGKWSGVMPFTEDHAVVFTGKKDNRKYHLIDKNGNNVRFLLGNGIELYGGTNVYDGQAVVWDTNRKFYKYNVFTGKSSSFKEPGNKQMDYLYCFMDVSNRAKTAPTYSFPEGQKGLQPVSQVNLYGYSEDGKVILPCQFSQATAFEDGLAVVTLQGQKGILRMVRGGADFALSIPTSHFVYDPGSSVNCAFQLTVPEVWSGKNMEVTVVDQATGERLATENTAGTYSFKMKPNSKESNYDISVASEGLALWSGSASYTFKKREMDLRVSLSIGSTKADKDDKVYVYATVTNPGSEAVTATITMVGSSAFKDFSKTETIGAGSSVKVSSYFSVPSGTLKNQHVSASTSRGGHDFKSGLTLTPFYE
ncbi:MAG: WG repeat-containing protein [Prevotella sp.]|nr:WG repeat-containing protein [Prevotella sp.]